MNKSGYGVHNSVGGVSVKKKQLTDNNYGKGSKGFYAALGISAVMIGAACLFAHDQGDSLNNVRQKAPDNAIVRDKAAGRPVADIPKAKATAPVTTAVRTERSVITSSQPVTIPAADISAAAPFEVDRNFLEHSQQAGADKLDAAKQPLSDMSSIINEFSSGELVKNATTGSWQTHNGTDISAEVGADVYAVSSGEISAVKNDPLWGVTVVIDHKNGFKTRYCGLGAELSVQQGDNVSSGDVIGAVGETADIESALAPHLHIEITHNGEYIDPMTVLG